MGGGKSTHLKTWLPFSLPSCLEGSQWPAQTSAHIWRELSLSSRVAVLNRPIQDAHFGYYSSVRGHPVHLAHAVNIRGRGIALLWESDLEGFGVLAS